MKKDIYELSCENCGKVITVRFSKQQFNNPKIDIVCSKCDTIADKNDLKLVTNEYVYLWD